MTTYDSKEIVTKYGHLLHIILGEKHGLKRIRIRIERPTYLNDQSDVKHSHHGHVEEERNGSWIEVQVINPDGTGSHRTKAGDPINRKVADALRDYGWSISDDNRIKALPADVAELLLTRFGVDLSESAVGYLIYVELLNEGDVR